MLEISNARTQITGQFIPHATKVPIVFTEVQGMAVVNESEDAYENFEVWVPTISFVGTVANANNMDAGCGTIIVRTGNYHQDVRLFMCALLRLTSDQNRVVEVFELEVSRTGLSRWKTTPWGRTGDLISVSGYLVRRNEETHRYVVEVSQYHLLPGPRNAAVNNDGPTPPTRKTPMYALTTTPRTFSFFDSRAKRTIEEGSTESPSKKSKLIKYVRSLSTKSLTFEIGWKDLMKKKTRTSKKLRTFIAHAVVD
jgi:hypothetical protein